MDRKKCTKRMAGRKKMPEINLVDIQRPIIRFQIQQALIDEGITLLDVSSERIIPGLVNMNTIGLSTGKPFIKKGPGAFGFLPQALDPKNFTVEPPPISAFLHYTFNFGGVSSGYSEEDDLYLFVIQVLDDNDVPLWAKIAQRVAKRFVIEENNIQRPQVLFSVTSMLLAGSEEDKAIIIDILTGTAINDEAVDAVSSDTMYPEDDVCEDEYEEY